MQRRQRAQPAMDASPADRPITATAALAALASFTAISGPARFTPTRRSSARVGGHPTAEDALGLLSLVVWALIITVSIKYCVFVMRADNHGEGGILALMALVTAGGRSMGPLIVAGLFGAALIYGDGIITPAISVLSALEGVNVVTDVLKPYVLPAALVVLLLLFGAQVKGTASIGRVFGPVMLMWFVVIALLGLYGVLQRPDVLFAIDPRHAVRVVIAHGWHTFVILGGVFLAITGGEALYADMGHFGRNPIRSSWYCVVLPALLLCYAGQTALLLENPGLEGNPFFQLAPQWAVVPLVVLATFATIIASQAIITGAFSLTRQAMQLGWFPGLNIRQTSDQEYGQIYVPVVNWTMMVCTLFLTFSFGSSDSLAGAYGTAVSTTMLLTTALLFNAMRDVWRWPLAVALLVSGGVSADRPGVLRRQPAEDQGGRLDPAAAGRADFPADDDMAPGYRRDPPVSGAEAGNHNGDSWPSCRAGRSPGFPAPRYSSAAAKPRFRRCWCGMSRRSRHCRRRWSA